MLNNSMSSLSSAEKEKVTTHDRTGKLQDLAVEYFQRAYGLGGRVREDHNDLCEEAVEVTQCSRRAFRELIYGHSYQAILGPLRDMVPGYKPKLPKREQRELQMQELEQSMSGSPGSRDDIMSSVPSRPSSFKLSSSAPPFESPKMLPQPPQAKFLTTLTPNGRVVSPGGPTETYMSKPKLADRVLTSPERSKPKSGISPEPMDLPGSYSRSSADTEARSDWGSPLPWPTPSPSDRRERDTSTPLERHEEAASNTRPASQEKADKAKEEKESEERTRGEATKAREEHEQRQEKERMEDRAKEEKEVNVRKEEVKETKPETTDAKHAKEEKEHQQPSQQEGVIEEALRDKGARVSRQDKTPKSRTNSRPLRSPQLTPSLFTSPLQPLSSSSSSSTSSAGDISSSSSSSSAAPPAPSSTLLKLVRFKICGEALAAALVFCMLRQYASYLADYPGRMSLQALWPLLTGSFVLFGLLLHRVLHSASKAQCLPMAIAADAEDYIETWELLHVGGDSRELVHALQEVQIMLGSLLQGLDVFQPAPSENGGINHAVRVLDYLSVIHKKLAGEIGNTVLVMRLVDSLRRMRMSLLKLCLSSETALPLLEPLSASLVAVNAVCLLVVVEPGSALFEILVLPAFVFLFALLQLVLTHLDSPFSSIAPLNLDSLKYMQKRVQNRITQLQKAE